MVELIKKIAIYSGVAIAAAVGSLLVIAIALLPATLVIKGYITIASIFAAVYFIILVLISIGPFDV